MSDLTYDGYAEIAERVDSARRASSRTYVAENIFKFVTVFCGALLVLSLVAAIGSMPAAVRWAMLATLSVLLLGGAVQFVFRPLFREWTDEEVAVRVEAKFPEIDNAVINSLQLAKDPTVRDRGFVSRLIDRAEQDTRDIRFSDAVERRKMMRFGASAAVVLICLAVYAFFFTDAFSRAMHRIVLPMAYVPAAGAADNAGALEVTPGSVTVLAGDPLRVRARYNGIHTEAIEGTVLYKPAGSAPAQREMKSLGGDKFAYTFAEVRAPFTYQVEVGRALSEEYQVTVTERPVVTRIDVEYHFPKYAGQEARREDDSNGDIKALAGTRAVLLVTANKPIDAGWIQGYGSDLALRIDRKDARRLRGAIVVLRNGSYTIKLVDRDGNKNQSPVIHRITALPDRPPTVRITTPGQKVTTRPGGRIGIAFRAKDDHGIVVAELISRREHSKDEGAPVTRWTRFAKPRNVQETYTWHLDPKTYRAGNVIEYWVQVTDNRWHKGASAGQTVRTPVYRIEIQDKSKLAEERIRRLRGWQERLRKVLEQETAIRTTATAMEKLDDAKQFAAMTRSVVKSQADARLETLRVAGDIGAAEGDLGRVKEALYVLGRNTMAEAVRRGEQVELAATLPEKKAELKNFEKVVDKVIASIKSILGILPRLEEQARKEKDEEEGFDLSDELKEKLQELERGLKDFIEEQRKVIKATQELAQKNVDDFTDEDDRKLKALAAIEDKWSQFFIEKHNDLSKLPEQDFANSSLLKELIEIQSEVKMAKGALAKKATEIATAIEDNALELAKKLETHIEKWLPDTPDRDQWKMEETLGEAEAPMAELPKELEDLVGDLMEEEEDLMNEVEDATAGYADSLDKGAGWDAMDGPISNMSAQGVTGNRLPNKSEIGGRSGEGRTGRSSGEFVEQDATGKGGRKTPTRLAPEAFEKGQINDTSKDPVGGATGGGKASGAGAGGLEGPTPPQVKAKLKNLAQRQAELRNRAEKINAKFKVMSWPTTFDETVKAMKATEIDLRNGRYRNALRRRPILLKNLKGTRTFLRNQIRVNRDYSNPLPNYLQDEILDATGGGTPRGYDKLLSDYFKSISRQSQ